MEKKSGIVGWDCWVDFIDPNTNAEKGKVLRVEEHGIIIFDRYNHRQFIPWCQIKGIVERT
ncbi:hypothetical protein [Candidatus Formimonas warabiya]|uniref:Uncharacterized protein n=1 Tax=Formimonas warabiya TaxID=1761012 RepID=A0A3G1KNV7_FORW1|nr:hypothetical protein [Candidatus Formimonas warabiya]ATW24149.1 hypothetical protein DCMF_04560 [Candidatus Formimonas warabiya]